MDPSRLGSGGSDTYTLDRQANWGAGYGFGVRGRYGYAVADGFGVGREQVTGTFNQFVQACVEAGTITGRFALKLDDLELRRIIIEALGPDRFYRDVDAKVVHQDIDGAGNPRRLLRVPCIGTRHGYLQAVEVICPTTGRVYHLGVPATVKTCQEAVAGIAPLRLSACPNRGARDGG
jgi:hypothetical protein